MTPLSAIRAAKPPYYPDQAIFAEWAAAALELGFTELDGGTGLIFTVTSGDLSVPFGAGRGSFFPQNTATAATLANDKYMANALMTHAGIANLGGNYFFLHDRHRAHRPPGHERSDAYDYVRGLDYLAFVKPLNGSRGDFASAIESPDEFRRYLDSVQQHYDAVIVQPVFHGHEYRVFVLDDDIVYSVIKSSPVVIGDGKTSVRDLIAAKQSLLEWNGVSAARLGDDADLILRPGEQFSLVGRTNLSAGGNMHFAEPDQAEAVFSIARRALKALGLRAGAVDLFVPVDDAPAPTRVIEVNANPSIRFLETAGRDDLILRIWRHTFASQGLIDV